MPIQYYCVSCQTRLSISRTKIGQDVPCPVCSELTNIPADDQLASVDHSGMTPQVIFAEASDENAMLAADVTEESEEASTTSSDPFFRCLIDDETTDDQGALQFRRGLEDEEEMDLTPMVDVTFLLLIFFMITASFSLEKTIPTPVPDPNEQSAAQPIQQEDDLLEKSILIGINADNTITLDEEPIASPEFLRDLLTTSMQRDQKAEALVTVADAAHQQTVVFVLDTANEVGMQKIRLATGEAAN